MLAMLRSTYVVHMKKIDFCFSYTGKYSTWIQNVAIRQLPAALFNEFANLQKVSACKAKN